MSRSGSGTAELQRIAAAAATEARALRLSVDEDCYRGAGKDPGAPILCAGNPGARICSLGRDLGGDEVRYGQPQVGPSGALVRRGVLAALGLEPSLDDVRFDAALEHVFLSNLVPYKPPMNRAFGEGVRARFRPLVERLLVCVFRGDVVLTLGAEAFRWFAPLAGSPDDAAAWEQAWKRPDRFERELTCTLTARCGGKVVRRTLMVCPLPHPSPANAVWRPLFPGLLAKRLRRFL